MVRLKCFLLALFLLQQLVWAQRKGTYHIRTIAFYNVENLFDTTNDSLIFDDERTPKGSYRWTEKRYRKKITHISKVLSEIGFQMTKTSPDVIGLCEVENRKVVEDLINHAYLKESKYGILHEDSPDERGIDVALLYKEAAFLPISFQSRRLVLIDEAGYRDYTRDQLVVEGLLDEEKLYFIVNHWPSRSGGELRSRPNRIAAARLNKRIMDSIRRLDANAKIICMGDLNDDPESASVKKVLKTRENLNYGDSLSLFNPMEKLYRKGLGTLAYRDKWNLFDQFVLTPNLLSGERNQFVFWKAAIFAPAYLIRREGRYKGYPFRTYVGTTYQGGYADHFPVYFYFIRQMKYNDSLESGNTNSP